MPILLTPDELQPGLSLADSLVDNGRVMLRAGLVLSRQDIEALRRRYPLQHFRVSDPVLDSVLAFEDDRRDREVARQVRTAISRCLGSLQQRLGDRAVLDAVHLGRLRSTVAELMQFLADNPVSAALVAACTDPRKFVAQHTGNVFYLSMLLAHRALDYVQNERRRQLRATRVRPGFAADLVPLGLGALLMDIGLLPHEGLLRLDRPLTEAEALALREHPLTSVDRLPPRFSALVRMLGRTHHENLAGAGYPKALSAERLHVFARIARIADAFDAATSDQIFCGARSPTRVLWEMSQGPMARFYDPVLMRDFARLIQPFPIGLVLQLADGRGAVIVKYNRQNPFDPQVVIAFDSAGQRLPREQLKGPLLLSAHGLRIARALDEDLSFLYEKPGEREVAVAASAGGPPRPFRWALEALYP